MTAPVKIRQSERGGEREREREREWERGRERERTRGWGSDGNRNKGGLTVLESHYDHTVSI